MNNDDNQPSENLRAAPARRTWFRRVWRVVVVGLLIVFGWVLGSELMANRIEVGDRAPEFTATSQTGETISLSGYRGRQTVVVYFYPKDNTPGCTTQACSFRDSYAEFTDAGAVVIGVSGDTSESHKEFAASRNLPFLLVSDRDGELRKAFGVPTTFGIIPGRVTYVIDREGIVRMKFNSQLNPKRHIDEALQMVKQLNRGTEA